MFEVGQFVRNRQGVKGEIIALNDDWIHVQHNNSIIAYSPKDIRVVDKETNEQAEHITDKAEYWIDWIKAVFGLGYDNYNFYKLDGVMKVDINTRNGEHYNFDFYNPGFCIVPVDSH